MAPGYEGPALTVVSTNTGNSRATSTIASSWPTAPDEIAAMAGTSRLTPRETTMTPPSTQPMM